MSTDITLDKNSVFGKTFICSPRLPLIVEKHWTHRELLQLNGSSQVRVDPSHENSMYEQVYDL